MNIHIHATLEKEHKPYQKPHPKPSISYALPTGAPVRRVRRVLLRYPSHLWSGILVGHHRTLVTPWWMTGGWMIIAIDEAEICGYAFWVNLQDLPEVF